MGPGESDGVTVGADDATHGQPASGPAGSGRHGAPGQRLGPYEILGELGRGGMGVVYRARHSTLGSGVALKVIIQGRDAEPDAVKRFIREAKAAAQLAGHPGIVGVHDIGEFEGRVYFAMDLIEGASLEKLIDEQRVTPQQAAGLIEQAARAVHHAHQHGILHRDLKPANILVTTDGRARVTDFGLAQVRAAGPEASRLTKSGQVLGTPAYMSPEQAESGSLDARADVWSLGATLYEALVGEPPFPGDTIYNVLAKVLRADPVPPRKRDPRVPRELETITLDCLEKGAERRYPTAEALAEDLARWTKGEAILARPPGAVERAGRWVRRHRAFVTAAGAALAVGVAILAVVTPGWRAAAATARMEEAARRRREAARPHLDRARDALARLQMLLTRPDWTQAQVDALAMAAQRDCEQGLAISPGLPEAFLELARSLAYTGRDEAAIEWCTRAVDADRTFTPARLMRGELLLAAYARGRLDRRGGVRPETPDMLQKREAAGRDLAGMGASGGPSDLEMAAGLELLAGGRFAEAANRLYRHAQARIAEPGAWSWAGQAALLARNLERAVDALDRAIGYRPRDSANHLFRAVTRLLLGDLPGALADADVAVTLAPQSVEALCERGFLRAKTGNKTGALADYDAALTLAPRDALALYNRGVTREALGDLDGAFADYDRAIGSDRSLAEAWTNRGLLRFRKGDAAGAVADYEAALRVDSRFAQALLNRAQARRVGGDLAGALADYAAVLAVNPKETLALAARGAMRDEAGDSDGALEDYDAALAVDPRQVPALVNRGALRKERGDLEGAIADYEAALAVEPGHANAHFHRAIARRSRDDESGARADYDAAIARDPAHVKALVNRAVLRGEAGDSDGALADLGAALRIAPTDAMALSNRSIERLGRRDFAGAIADLDALLAAHPDSVRALVMRGNTRRAAGDLPRALADYEAAVRLDPKDDAALCMRGVAREDAGDLDGALADYDGALVLDPSDPSTLYNRGTLRLRRGDPRGAADDLQAALANGLREPGLREFAKRHLADARAALAAQGTPK